jgi:hypothetical protein
MVELHDVCVVEGRGSSPSPGGVTGFRHSQPIVMTNEYAQDAKFRLLKNSPSDLPRVRIHPQIAACPLIRRSSENPARPLPPSGGNGLALKVLIYYFLLKKVKK